MIFEDPSHPADETLKAASRAGNPGKFVDQLLQPLIQQQSQLSNSVLEDEIHSDQEFWSHIGSGNVGVVSLTNFKVTDWFPRAPGVCWSPRAQRVRESIWDQETYNDPVLGRYVSPSSKMSLIEDGGIGSIRLLPKAIDGEFCHFSTALEGDYCHAGIPLAIPRSLVEQSGFRWGDRMSIRGRVRFLQEFGLEEPASRVHHQRPVILFVEQVLSVSASTPDDFVIISPVALFDSKQEEAAWGGRGAQYTYVQCVAGKDSDLDEAEDWIQIYTSKYSGRVITNYDEQRPTLADAPLSYQNLVSRTYDRKVLEKFHGEVSPSAFESIYIGTYVREQKVVENNFDISGTAIVNINSTLTNVTQQINNASGLDSAQKTELGELVKALKTDLDAIKATHAGEVQEIVGALDKAVATASKPPADRKKSFLELSAKGLKDAAELVKDVAPAVLATAGLIAKFIAGL